MKHPPYITWPSVILLIVSMMLFGLCLDIYRPIYLAPPLFRYTHIIYGAIALMWLPTLIICGMLKPSGHRLMPIIFIILSAPMFLCFSTLLAMSLLWGLGSGQDCAIKRLSSTEVQYSCDIGIFADAGPVETFNSSINSLVMFPANPLNYSSAR